MQAATSSPQVQRREEERYADGFAEYSNFYGGPTFNSTPSRLSSQTGQGVPADPNHKGPRQTSPQSNNYLPANALDLRKDSEGLQLANPLARHGSLHAYEQGLMLDARSVEENVTGSAMSPPPPLKFVKKVQGSAPRDSLSPTTPTSPGFHQHPSMPGYLSPASSRPASDQMAPSASSPQQLQFLKRAPSLPPTPPMSYGSSGANEYGFPERLQSLHISQGHSDAQRYPVEPLRLGPAGLARMNTTSSLSSARSSSHMASPVQSLPTSPFGQPRPFSYAISTLNAPIGNGSEMSPTDAQAEVLRRLSNKSVKDAAAGGVPAKKGFSLKRTNTPAKVGHSQDEMTDVLEEVALEGSLSLVKAVIALGADPIYRSNGKLKKVKHEALGKATLNGNAKVVDFLLQKGATYGEVNKKSTFTSLDRALLAAVYKGHADLAVCLISSHNANPMVEQWPREMYDTQHYWAETQVRLQKTSVLDGISKWKNVEQGIQVLLAILQNPKFDPAALVSGVFDTKSELQSAEFNYRPWQTTYEYSALSCFVRAGWADAVEEMLSMKGTPADYEAEDEVLQYQDKVTRKIAPVNALTKETWESRPDDALRILRLLIDRGFDVGLAQRSASDLGVRSALSRALSADAAQGVELILQHKPSLVREEISFRRNKKETKALPFAAAMSLGALETARVLLRAGAHARDPAFDKMNNFQFAAHQDGDTTTTMLAEMIGMAPELTYDALGIAINKLNLSAVRVLLQYITRAAMKDQIAQLPPVYDMILLGVSHNKEDFAEAKYLDLIELIKAWDAGSALDPPQLPVLLAAIRKDNFIGMQRLLKFGIVDARALALNSRGQPLGEQGIWTILECCELTNRSEEWLGLLRHFGAPLY